MSDERFIPFRKSDVVTMCADEVSDEEREPFRAVVELLESLLHHEFRGRLEALKDAYYPFNPDVDVRSVREPSAAERRRRAGTPRRGADRPRRGRQLRADQPRRPGPGVRRGVVGEGPAGGRLRRLRARRVLPPRRAHPRGAGEAVVRAAPHGRHVHELRESPRLREVQGRRRTSRRWARRRRPTTCRSRPAR